MNCDISFQLVVQPEAVYIQAGIYSFLVGIARLYVILLQVTCTEIVVQGFVSTRYISVYIRYRCLVVKFILCPVRIGPLLPWRKVGKVSRTAFGRNPVVKGEASFLSATY